MPTTFAVMGSGGFSFKEKLFFAFAWSPKVRSKNSVQASNSCLTAVSDHCVHAVRMQFR